MNSLYTETIAAIYSASIDEPLWADALDLCQQFVESKGCVLLMTGVSEADDVMQLNFGSELWRQVAASDMEHYLRNLAHYDQPAYHKLSTISEQSYILDYEFNAGVANLRDRPDYQYMIEKVGVCHRIAVRLNDNKSWFDTGTWQFDKNQTEATKQQIQNILALTPHMAKSVEMARAWNLLRTRYAAVLGAMDKIQIGLLVVRSNGLIVEHNIEAARILSDYGCISKTHDGYLKLADSSYQAELQSGLLAATTKDNKDKLIAEAQLHLQKSGEYSILVEISPLIDSLRELDGEQNSTLVLLIDTQNTHCISTDRLSMCWSLSDSESEVCRHLVDGKTNRTISEIRGVSLETIKTQVASTFTKTNCSNRAELIHLASKTSPPIEGIQKVTDSPAPATLGFKGTL